MGFQHPAQQAHKIQGLQQAIQSPDTPAHLKPHLRQKVKEHMKSFKGQPITGGKPQFKPKAPSRSLNSVLQAQANVAAPASPFRNPAGVVNIPAGAVPNPKPSVGKAAGLGAVGGAKLKTKSKMAGKFYGE